MRILVTNDDGIDSLGLHALANAMRPYGEVVVVAPASEYSGAGASLGTLTFDEPIARPLRRPEPSEVISLDLAIDKIEIPATQLSNECGEGNL